MTEKAEPKVYQRTIVSRRAQGFWCPTDDLTDAADWLGQHAHAYGLPYLLAHADDGVLWGYHDGKTLTPAPGPLALRLVTLQQARLFGSHGELLLWQDHAGWHARLLWEGPAERVDAFEPFGTWAEAYDEPHLLWGTHGQRLDDTFVETWEGATHPRFRQTLPLPRNRLSISDKPTELPRQPALTTRHYLANTPHARVAASRLVTLDLQSHA